MKRIFFLILFVKFLFFFTGVGDVFAAPYCTGTKTYCNYINQVWQCGGRGGRNCVVDSDCDIGEYCRYIDTECDGQDICGCNYLWPISRCDWDAACQSGQVFWSANCSCNPDWNCTTTCGYPGGWVPNGCGSNVWCGATAPCCSATNPETPTLSSPGIGTSVPINQSVNLDWNAISSWGTGCPQDNDYEVCVSSNNSTCDYVNLTAQGDSATNYNWTPTTGDASVYWNIRAHNGSNASTSSTWTLCVENEFCGLKCGQAKMCGGNCTTDDAGGPAAPTAVSPLGTVAAPAIFPIGSNINFDWSSNSNLTEYYRVLVRDAGNMIVASDLGVSIPTTEKTFGPFNTPGLYRWYVDAVNTDCGVTDGPNSVDQYFRINSPPTIVRILVADSDGHAVTNDNTTDNHICKKDFAQSTNPKEVVFGIFVNDPDGIGDSGSPPVLHWNGQNYTSAWTGVGGGNNAAQVRVDYASYVGAPPQSLYDVTATYSDRWGVSATNNSPALPTMRLRWKVWNCEVLTSGTLFKASDAIQSCPTIGFTDPIDDLVDFNSIVFSDSPDITMTDDDLDSYGPDNIIWGKTYLPFINGGNAGGIDGTLLATGRVTRMIDLGVGTTRCPNGSSLEIGYTRPADGIYNVSPYSADPRVQIDFSFIRDQEAWYQVEGAGVKSKTLLQYGVPVTVLPVTSKFLTLGDLTKDNGLVSTTNFSNVYGNNLKDDIGSPKNWYLEQNTNDDDIYNYNYFYNNFYVKAGIGETKSSWGGWVADQIYFVNGDLTINDSSPAVNPNTQTMMIIVSGNITIQSGVTNLDGIYIADGSITAIGDNSAPLTINGMLYAGGSVGLYRSFTDKTDNNTAPAVKVNYSPGLIFNLPPEIMRVLSGWREE